VSLTAERLKAIRLECQVRRHGGFVLLMGDRLHLFGAPRYMPSELVTQVMGTKNEMARHIRNEFEARTRE
jgi:hypothetical protein